MNDYLHHLLKGMGSLLDIAGTSTESTLKLSRQIRIGSPEDDAKAIRGDFEKLGASLRKAMDELGQKKP